MESDHSRVILRKGDCALHSVHTARLHHRDFPELWVECESPEAAVSHLINQMVRALDSTASQHRRAAIASAIKDIQALGAFLAQSATCIRA